MVGTMLAGRILKRVDPLVLLAVVVRNSKRPLPEARCPLSIGPTGGHRTNRCDSYCRSNRAGDGEQICPFDGSGPCETDVAASRRPNGEYAVVRNGEIQSCFRRDVKRDGKWGNGTIGCENAYPIGCKRQWLGKIPIHCYSPG